MELNSVRIAIHRSNDPAEKEALQRKLDDLKERYRMEYHMTGFAHTSNIVFTSDKPFEPQLFYWGLIPSWIKDSKSAKEVMNKTINARGETIFEKPAFRTPAKNRRCLVYAESFFEHHHANGKTYPFRIRLKDGSPLILAGLWDTWTNPDNGELIHTYTLVTTEANPLMTKIHNNPKAEGPRMPVILSREEQDEWLKPIKTDEDKKQIQSLIKPLNESLLDAYTVGRLKGKEALGNVPAVREPVKYGELLWS